MQPRTQSIVLFTIALGAAGAVLWSAGDRVWAPLAVAALIGAGLIVGAWRLAPGDALNPACGVPCRRPRFRRRRDRAGGLARRSSVLGAQGDGGINLRVADAVDDGRYARATPHVVRLTVDSGHELDRAGRDVPHRVRPRLIDSGVSSRIQFRAAPLAPHRAGVHGGDPALSRPETRGRGLVVSSTESARTVH